MPVAEPRKRTPGPDATPTRAVEQAPRPPSTTRSIPDPYGIRSRAQDHHRRICREAERLRPLARYYAGPPLLAVPIGEYYVRGRWAV